MEVGRKIFTLFSVTLLVLAEMPFGAIVKGVELIKPAFVLVLEFAVIVPK